MIIDLYGAAGESVVFQVNVLCFGSNPNGGSLVLAGLVFQAGLNNADIACASLDVNADSALLAAIVTDEAILNAVAMAASECVGLFAKEDAHLAIALDGAGSNDVVGVTVSDTDAVSCVFR